MKNRLQLKNPASVWLVSCLSVMTTCLPLLDLHATEAVVFENGNRTEAPAFTYGDGKFTAPDRNVIPREQVRDWWLGNAEAKADNQKTARTSDAEAVKELKEYRALAAEFAKAHPGVSGIHLIDDGEFTLTADHRHVYRYHFVGYVMDESKLEWRQLGLGFTEGRSRSRIIRARSLNADDELFVLDPAQTTVNTPSRGAVHFDPNSRVINAVIPGVEVGSVVEFIYEFEKYEPADWRIFFPSYFFQGDIPVWSSTFRVRVPKSERLYSWEQNWQLPKKRSWFNAILDVLFFWDTPRDKSIVRGSDGEKYRQYSWARHEMPPLTDEPQMPPANEITPAVYGTTMEKWDHLNQLNREMQLERLKPTDEIRQLTAKITAGCENADAKIARLYHWVQKNVRYISIKASLSSGWAGHPAEETLEQGYGDCTDKSALLSTMLRTIGVKGTPVVLRTNDAGLFDPKYPVLACNHAIVEVEHGGRLYYLDPTSSDYRYPAFRADDHGAIAFNFIDGTQRRIPVPPGMQANGKQSEVRIELKTDGGIVVEVKNAYTGAYEAGLRGGWKRVPEKARGQVMQQYLNGIAPGAKLRSFELSDPEDLSTQYTMSFTYEIPNYVSYAGEYRIFEMPDRALSFPEVALENRKHPVAYTTSEAERRRVALLLPPGMSFVEEPQDIAVKHRDVQYTESFRMENEQSLVFESFFERTAQRIFPEDYNEYRKTTLDIHEKTTRPIYIRSAKTNR